MTDLKIKWILGGIGNFYRCRLQILANLSGKHFGWNGTQGRKTSFRRVRLPQGAVRPILRTARLQKEIAPDNVLNRYDKWFEQRKKGSDKRSEMCLKNFKPLSRRLKITHRHFSESFSPPKLRTKSVFFSPRGSAGVATRAPYSCFV